MKKILVMVNMIVLTMLGCDGIIPESEIGEYLTFSAEAEQTLEIYESGFKIPESMEYCVGEGEWQKATTEPIVFGGEKGKLRLRAISPSGTSPADPFGNFLLFYLTNETVPVECSGDLRTLVDWKNPEEADTSQAAFKYLFSGNVALISAPKLPATKLAPYCYDGMFYGCTNLKEAPELPATTLSEECYVNMFANCTSLTQVPDLPATTLATGCYAQMFIHCTSLEHAPEIAATTLAEACYDHMFANCINLTQGPTKLPATILKDGCYQRMFSGCLKLTEAPKLPARTLAPNCYDGMFASSGLESAPELIAEELAAGCYSTMFAWCHSLTEAPRLKAKTLSPGCYSCMFFDCANLKEAPILEATTLADNCYSRMFDNCPNITKITVEATENLSATGAFSQLLKSSEQPKVAPSGTIYVKTQEAKTVIESYDDDTVPAGWSVVVKE